MKMNESQGWMIRFVRVSMTPTVFTGVVTKLGWWRTGVYGGRKKKSSRLGLQKIACCWSLLVVAPVSSRLRWRLYLYFLTREHAMKLKGNIPSVPNRRGPGGDNAKRTGPLAVVRCRAKYWEAGRARWNGRDIGNLSGRQGRWQDGRNCAGDNRGYQKMVGRG